MRLRAHNQPVAFRTGRVARPAPAVRTEPTRGEVHQSNLLTLLSAVESATIADLSYVMDLGMDRCRFLLSLLEAEGRIERTGTSRTIHYRLP